MPISRREFFKHIIIPALAGIGISTCPLFAFGSTSNRRLIVGAQDSVCFIDLANRSVKKINIGFSPHSFLQHPNFSTRYLAIEKWGSHATEIDSVSGTQKPLSSGDKHLFYGHGIVDTDLGAIFITRVDTNTGLGHLVGYDMDNYDIKFDFQVTPGGLHDCHRMPDNTVMIASSGIHKDLYAVPQKGIRIAPTSLVRIDLIDNGKVLSELKIEDPHQVIAHFAVTRDGAILALSGPFGTSQDVHGQLYYSPDGQTPLRALRWDPTIDNALKDEMLSVSLNKDQTLAAVTNPVSGIISLIDMKEGKVLKTTREPFHSIAFDQENNVFLGAYNQLESLDDHFLNQKTIVLNEKQLFDGAHSLLPLL